VRILSNGLQVIVIERRSLPLITLRLAAKAGAEADPPDGSGTAQMVSALLNQGTGRRSALEIAEAVDRIGGSLDTGAEWDSSYADLRVLSDQAETAFDLLADMVMNPTFASSEVERKRRQMLSALEVAHDDPNYLADAAIDCVIFAGTSYGHPQDGTLESVRRLSPGDLRAFHGEYYRPSNALLAVVGDITKQRAEELSEKYFGTWKGSGVGIAPPPSGVLPEKQRQVLVINKPDAVQTEIRIANPGIPRASADYYALTVANQILGGPATNRLFSALRTRRGLTYGASSELDCRRSAGSWEAKTFTRTEETVKTLDVVLDQMSRLRAEVPGVQEFSTAQSYLTGHLALQFESSESVATQMLELKVHGLSLDYWNHFPSEIQKLTPEMAGGTLRHYLDPERAVIVLVGNAQGFARDLKKLGRVRVIPLAKVDFASPTLERPSSTGGKPQP
jgi:zinc protease